MTFSSKEKGLFELVTKGCSSDRTLSFDVLLKTIPSLIKKGMRVSSYYLDIYFLKIIVECDLAIEKIFERLALLLLIIWQIMSHYSIFK